MRVREYWLPRLKALMTFDDLFVKTISLLSIPSKLQCKHWTFAFAWTCLTHSVYLSSCVCLWNNNGLYMFGSENVGKMWRFCIKISYDWKCWIKLNFLSHNFDLTWTNNSQSYNSKCFVSMFMKGWKFIIYVQRFICVSEINAAIFDNIKNIEHMLKSIGKGSRRRKSFSLFHSEISDLNCCWSSRNCSKMFIAQINNSLIKSNYNSIATLLIIV